MEKQIMAGITTLSSQEIGNRRVIYTHAHNQGHLVVVRSLDKFNHPKIGMPSFEIKGRGRAANEIACNVFLLLKKAAIPTCFIEKSKVSASYSAYCCDPISLRVVVRRSAHGSFLKRYPHKEGEVFTPPIVEIFLKDCNLGNPIVVPTKRALELHHSNQPLHHKTPFQKRELSNHGITNLSKGEDVHAAIETMEDLATKAFEVIEAEFAKNKVVVLDINFEFGICPKGKIVIMDPIDNKAWRILGADGRRLDGGAYYQNIKVPTEEDYNAIRRNFEEVVRITDHWHHK